MQPYYTLFIRFTGKQGKQRKSKRQSFKIPHDIPFSCSPDHKYTEKSVFIDTVVNNAIKENAIKLDRPEIDLVFWHTEDLGNGMTRTSPFDALSHEFTTILAKEIL